MALQRHAVIVVLIGAWWAVQAARYVPVFHSNLTVYAHAVRMAPEKPRPLLNLGVMYAARGQFDRAEALFVRAGRAAEQAHVRDWDRDLTRRDVRANRAALVDLRARMGQ